jgi:hypothetical protein
MSLCQELFWQSDCLHESPDLLSHARLLPVLPASQQAKIAHQLSEEVPEFSEQGLVKCIFFDFLKVYAVDLAHLTFFWLAYQLLEVFFDLLLGAVLT